MDGGGETEDARQGQSRIDDVLAALLLSGDDARKLQALQRVLDSADALQATVESDAAISTLCGFATAQPESSEVQRVVLDVLVACIYHDETILVRYNVMPRVVTAIEDDTGSAMHLAQFLQQLKEIKPNIALYPLCPKVARVSLGLLLHSNTTCAAVRVLIELLELLVREGKDCKNAINDTLLKMIDAATGRTSGLYTLQRWQRITIWKLGPHLPDVADILREGNCVEQVILLKCLSGSKYSVLEAFVLFHQGGPVLAELSRQEEYLDVQQLALDLEREVVSRNPEYRSRFALVQDVEVQESGAHSHHPFQEEAMEMLCSDFFLHSITNRDLLVDSGILGTLVRLLVREENAAKGEVLVAYLRDLTAADYREELDMNVKVQLENAIAPGSPSLYEKMYFQNLVPLYCQVDGLQLGKLEGIDKLIHERLILEVLRDNSKMAQLAALYFIHDAMELSDRYQFEDQRSNTIAIAGILHDYVDDLVAVSKTVPEEGRDLVRQILLALDRSLADVRFHAAAEEGGGMQIDACSDIDEDGSEQSEETHGYSDTSDDEDDGTGERVEPLSDENAAPSGWLDEAVRKLESGTEGSIIVALDNFNERPFDILYVCNEYNVLAILSKLLERPSTSDAIKLRIWALLLTFVDDLRPPNTLTVRNIRTLIAIVLHALTCNPSLRELAMEMLRSHALYDCAAARELLVDCGILGTLVSLLFREENATRAGAILAYLRDFSEPNYIYGPELNVCIETLLEAANAPGSPFEYGAVYFQNLVRWCCDDSGLQLGKLGSLDKEICVRLSLDVLRYGSYLAKLATALFLHDTMELSARYQFGNERSDTTATARILSDCIDDLVVVSTTGPEIICELLRHILSALDVSLVSDRLDDVRLDAGDDTQAGIQMDEEYFYSDDDDEAEGEQDDELSSDDDERHLDGHLFGSAENGCEGGTDQKGGLTVADGPEMDVEAPESVGGELSSDGGDWELI